MRRLIIACATLLLLAGCATMQKPKDLRDQTLEAYAAALRWGDITGAWNFVDPAYRAAHPLSAQRKALYGTVRVAEYDVAGLHETDPNTVEQTAHISLIEGSSQHVYSVLDHQTWHWDETAKKWWLESGLPDITQQ